MESQTPNRLSKHCFRCHETKSLDNFTPNKYAKDGKHGWCRECVRDYGRMRYARDKRRLQNEDPLEKYELFGDSTGTMDVEAMHAERPYREMMAMCEAFEQRIKR